MKIIVIIASLLVHVPGWAMEITPREWVSFLHQISKRAPAQLNGPNVGFALERKSTDGREVDLLTLVGVRDDDGDFVPTALVQVEQERRDGGYLVTATQVELSGELRSVQSRLLTAQSAQSEEPEVKTPTDAQKADWSKSLEAWRAQVGQMPDRVGRFDAKEVAI